MSSLRAGMGSATACGRLKWTVATRAAKVAPAPRRFLSSRRLMPTTSMLPKPTRCPAILASASGADSEGFSPSPPQQTSEERRRSSGSGAVAIPWYYITPARTFLAASSLKLISFTMTTTFFATAVLPFGFWQTALAVAGGVGLALLAKKLEAEKFVEKASKVQWVGLVASVVLAAVLFSRLVPGRINASLMGGLDVSPRSVRTLNGNNRESFSSNPSSLPPAPVRSPLSEASRPRVRTRAEADAFFAEFKNVVGGGGGARR